MSDASVVYWILPLLFVVLVACCFSLVFILCFGCFCLSCCFCGFKCCLIPYFQLTPSNVPLKLKIYTVVFKFAFSILPVSLIQKISKKSDPKSDDEVGVRIEIINAHKGYRMQMNVYEALFFQEQENTPLIHSIQEEENEEEEEVTITIEDNENTSPFKINRGRIDRVILLFHAGGFVLGDPNEIDHVCKELIRETNDQKARVTVIAPNYRKAPRWKMEDILKDAETSFEYVLKNYCRNQKNTEIIIMGESAGGHMASYLVNKLRDQEYELFPKENVHCVLIYPHLTDSVTDSEIIKTLESRRTYEYGIIVNHFFDDWIGKKLKWDNPVNAYSCLGNFKNATSHFIISADYDYTKSDAYYCYQKLNEFGCKNLEYFNVQNEIHRFLVPDTSVDKNTWRRIIKVIINNINKRFDQS